MMRRMLVAVVRAIVDASGRRPGWVLALASAVLVATWWVAVPVLTHPHTDLRELLPLESPALKSYEQELGRVGGRAALLVIAKSRNRAANERFADDLGASLRRLASRDPEAAQLIAFVESDTREVRDFFQQNRWLYASLPTLEHADDAVDFQVALQSGMVADLDDDPRSARAERPALGLADEEPNLQSAIPGQHDVAAGYFESDDGRTIGVRVVSRTTGMGDVKGDTLFARVKGAVSDLHPTSYDPAMQVGYAGDIPNAADQRASLVSEAAWATGLALVLIACGIVWFFRAPSALWIVGCPAVLGVGAAYAFASVRFGYVNTTGMFLGAMILGNGVNYPIVLLARYREFRRRGDAPHVARRTAVENALRAELVGASVAAVAYGSLAVTDFRGFTQFAWIGLVGMLLVWIAMIPCVPALVVVAEAIQPRLPAWLRDRPADEAPPRGEGRALRGLASLTERHAGPVLLAAALATCCIAARVPSFLRDPWQYDFSRLGSRESQSGGAGYWSVEADRAFGGKTNVTGTLILADTAEEVPALKAQILANDSVDPQGSLITSIATVTDLLPGSPEEQAIKLGVLARIRDRLTPNVLARLPDDERATASALRPPPGLHALTAMDLPELLRRRFEENDGRLGTVLYVRYKPRVIFSDGRTLLRMARATDNVRLQSGHVVQTASRATVFAELIRSMRRDGPRAAAASLVGVVLVVLLATQEARLAFVVLASLAFGTAWLLGAMAWSGERLNYVNFVALPITFGIGCEYPFNIADRARLLGGNAHASVTRVGGAVALCSYTTVIGYGSMMFADLQALASFGRIAVVGELACVAGALVVVPALLHMLAGRRTSAVRSSIHPCA